MQMLGIAAKPSQSPLRGEELLSDLLKLGLDNKQLESALKELAEQRDRCNAAFKQANDAIKEANEKLKKIEQDEADISERETLLQGDLESLAADKAAMAQAKADLDMQTKAQAEKFRQLNEAMGAKRAELENREKAIQDAELIVTKRSQAVQEREQAVAKQAADLASREAKLKAILG